MLIALASFGEMPWATAAVFQDNFADRQVLTSPSGSLDGSNVGATNEVNEPQHGGKPGGRSVWISWVAPADGVATFRVEGNPAPFDTLLSAYYFNSPADTTLDKLHEAARNDDFPGIEPASLIQFGARAQVRYEIAVDGFAGAAGEFRMRWDFLNATSPPPIILSVPPDQAARQGDPVTLTVDLQTSSSLDLKWRFNGSSTEVDGATYFIPSLQPTNVGRYALRIKIGSVDFETTPVELQINSDGITNVLARDKLIDSLRSALIGNDGNEDPGHGGGGLPFAAASVGVVRGYNGSQIFNTTFATSDPAEPLPCGVASGASYWLSYQPPTNGTVTLDTTGSSYDTVLAVYTYNAPPASYADLIPVTCDNDAISWQGPSRVVFAAVKSREYALVVAGVNGAQGIAQLNYRLDVSVPPVPPTLIEAPAARTVPAGADVRLQAQIAGSPPMFYSWSRAAGALDGDAGGGLLLPRVTPDQAGDYTLNVSNLVGAPLSIVVTLRVLVPPELRLLRTTDAFSLSFSTVAGQRYYIEEASAVDGLWVPWSASFTGDVSGILLTNLPADASRFYRIRVE